MRNKSARNGRFTANDTMESFSEKYVIDAASGCWNWTAAKAANGYGVFTSYAAGWKIISAHRASWMLHRGAIPDGLFVLHKCDNRACVNPDHHFLGTQKDNIADRDRKGRRPKFKANPRRGETNNKAKLTEAAVRQMRALRSCDGIPYYAIARIYGVSTHSAHQAILGKTWAHIA